MLLRSVISLVIRRIWGASPRPPGTTEQTVSTSVYPPSFLRKRCCIVTAETLPAASRRFASRILSWSPGGRKASLPQPTISSGRYPSILSAAGLA
jgi:hypothetical protein